MARPTLIAGGLGTFDAIDKSEIGWQSVFATLTEMDLDRMDFNTAAPGDGSPAVALTNSCNIPHPSFTAILQSFRGNNPDVNVIRKRDMNLRNYLRRLDAMNRIREGSVQQWARLIDPTESLNPKDLLCP